MQTAAINRQFLMGAVFNTHPAICSRVNSVIPRKEVLMIGDLTEVFTREISQVENIDKETCLANLNSHTDNVGVWLNTFCRTVLPFLSDHYQGQ